MNDAGVAQLIAAKHHQTKVCGGFMDVTAAWDDYKVKGLTANNRAKASLSNYSKDSIPALPIKKIAYSVKYEAQVNQLLKSMNPQDMWADLTTLTSFKDRYANSDNGVKAANWLKTQIETMAKNTGHDDVTVYVVPTGRDPNRPDYKQPSVVAKFGNSTEPGVVIGGHMDTLSSSFGEDDDDKLTTYDVKPGADDDGTGSVTVLEVARMLLGSGMHFKKPIYFVWYSTEELGLIGSGHVVRDFKNKKIPVSEVIQFDMTGYAYQNKPTMWFMDDYVNKDLTSYLEKLIGTYVKAPVQHSRCGYGCSDHASWHNQGFAAAMPFESSMGTDNPDIHTSRDTMEKLSLSHMTNFAKLGIAAAVDIGRTRVVKIKKCTGGTYIYYVPPNNKYVTCNKYVAWVEHSDTQDL